MDEEPRPPSMGLRVMAAFVILFVLIAVVVLPITMGTWDWLTVGIAVGGLVIVGFWALFGIRAGRRRATQEPPPDDVSDERR